MLLQLTIAGIAARGVPSIGSISLWPIVLFLVYLGMLYLTYRYRGQPRWTPSRSDDAPVEENPDADAEVDNQYVADQDDQTDSRSMKNLWLLFCGSAWSCSSGVGRWRNRLTCSLSRPVSETHLSVQHFWLWLPRCLN